jgi:hypothetical protein
MILTEDAISKMFQILKVIYSFADHSGRAV